MTVSVTPFCSISSSHCIGGGSPWTGTGNTNLDPDFVGGGDYTLTCGSPCINSGDTDTIEDDLVDLDEDASTNEPLPVDLAFEPRVLGADASPDTDWVDMGAYEKTFEPCLADTNSDGNVDIDDLLNVLNNWGTCGAPCPYDVAPGGPCGISGDGQVNIDDLLAVNNSWGECAESFGGGGGGGGGNETSQAVLDCMADAEAQELTGETYIEFMWECLCAKGVFDCD